MRITSDRFGTLEVQEGDIIDFPSGLIGFPEERRFALIRRSNMIAFLQSINNPRLALPVVSAHGLGAAYPDVPLTAAAEQAGLGNQPDDLAVLAVVCAPRGQPATVNLLAPIVVNATTRQGSQLLLEGSRFTTRELFVLPPRPEVQPHLAAG